MLRINVDSVECCLLRGIRVDIQRYICISEDGKL